MPTLVRVKDSVDVSEAEKAAAGEEAAEWQA